MLRLLSYTANVLLTVSQWQVPVVMMASTGTATARSLRAPTTGVWCAVPKCLRHEEEDQEEAKSYDNGHNPDQVNQAQACKKDTLT